MINLWRLLPALQVVGNLVTGIGVAEFLRHASEEFGVYFDFYGM